MRLGTVGTALVAVAAVACSSGSAHRAAAIAPATSPTVLASPSPTAVRSLSGPDGSTPGSAAVSSPAKSGAALISITPAATATDVVLYDPFSKDGATSRLPVSLATTGSCQGSLADDRPDAYRCFIDKAEPDGTNIEDPCFAGPNNPAFLLCAHDPSDPTVVRVTPTQPLPAAVAGGPDPTSGMPWTLVLTDGDRCGLITGGTNLVAGLRLNYGCVDGGDVYGDANRSTPLWRVYFTAKGAANLHQVQVAQAYF